MPEIHRQSQDATELLPDADIAFQLGNKNLVPEWIIEAARKSKTALPSVEIAPVPQPELTRDEANIRDIKDISFKAKERRERFAA